MGTVIVALYSKDDLVIAADSKNTRKMPTGTRVVDTDACKILLLTNGVVFAAAGLYGGSDWNVNQIAVQAAKNIAARDDLELQAFASRWAMLAQTRMENFFQSARGMPVHDNVEESRVSAIFAIRSSKAGIIVVKAEVRRIPGAVSSPFTSVKLTICQDGESSTGISTMGYGNSVWEELNAGTSPRAISEAPFIALLHKDTTPSSEDMASITKHIADLAAQWFPEAVGGPIDQLHLSPKEAVWLHHKPQCSN